MKPTALLDASSLRTRVAGCCRIATHWLNAQTSTNAEPGGPCFGQRARALSVPALYGQTLASDRAPSSWRRAKISLRSTRVTWCVAEESLTLTLLPQF